MKILKKVRIPLLTLGLAIAATITANAAVWNVPGSFSTIQAAIDAAASGDTVLVGSGVYQENLNFKSKNVSLQSVAGPAATVIHPTGGRCVVMGPSGALIGFTITGGQSNWGAGVMTQGSGSLIQGNIFDGNAQSAGGFGAAIGGNGSSPSILQNIFRHHTADGQWTSGVVSFVNSSSPIIENNVFEDNSCRAINLTLPQGNTPRIINNTIVRNTVGVRVDCRVPTSTDIFRNNLIVDNGIGLQIDFGSLNSAPTWQYNLVYGNTTDYSGIASRTGVNGNISADPMFVNPLSDYHLRFGSPAIDAGSLSGAPDIDFDNLYRPLDGNGDGIALTDIGAYECVPEPATFILLSTAISGFAFFVWRKRNKAH